MKKRYTILPKNWLRLGLIAFATSFSFSSSAQNGPAKQWDKTFGGSNPDRLKALQQTSDGGYILGGESASGITGNKSQACQGANDYWVVKLDASGNKTWDKTFGGSDQDRFISIQQTSDGGYILGGSSGSGISVDKSQASKGGTYDYWVVKLDASGNKIWDKTIGGSNRDELNSLQQTSDGGYILGGSSDSGVSGDKNQICRGGYDYWVVKLDASGNKIWDKTFGGSAFDELYSLQQTSDGGYILGGSSDSGVSGDKSQGTKGGKDYWVVKLDANGNKTWDKTFGGSVGDELTSLQQTSNGGYILGGWSESGISGDKTQATQGISDYWVIKLDASGNKTWDKTFGGSVYEKLFSLQQTSDGGYMLGGMSHSSISGDKSQASQGYYDYWIVKVDASGNKMWDKTIGGSNGDALLDLRRTSDGGYILGGESNSPLSGDKSQPSQGGDDFWIVKLAADVTGIKEPETNFAVSISPNPNQGKFTLQLNNLSAPKAEVTVSDLLGRVVLQQPLTVSNNQISEELTLPNAKGIYLLQVKVGEQILTRKIVVE